MNEQSTTPIPADFLSDTSKTGASYKQLNFLDSLLAERDIEASAREALAKRVAAQKLANSEDGEGTAREDGISKKRASDFISRLLDKPKAQKPRTLNYDTTGTGIPSPEELPAGHYAIENNEGELRFYHVWRGTRRPDYVKLYVEHGPDDSEVPFRSAVTILQKIIDAGTGDCARRYGHEIGACSTCSRRLTNRLSRELGIGPVCGGRFYAEDNWSGIKEEARETIRARGEDPSENIND